MNQKQINLSINDFKKYCSIYSKIIIEITPIDNKGGKFINDKKEKTINELINNKNEQNKKINELENNIKEKNNEIIKIENTSLIKDNSIIELNNNNNDKDNKIKELENNVLITYNHNLLFLLHHYPYLLTYLKHMIFL